MTDRETNQEDMRAAEYIKARLARNLDLQLRIWAGVSPDAMLRVFTRLWPKLSDDPEGVIEDLEHLIFALTTAEFADNDGESNE
jgi:hypothetical protein